MDLTGQSVAHYHIGRKLGEGGMGVVWEATDTRLDRKVAVKILREAHSAGPARERFWREARAAARLNHPNICQIYEVGEYKDVPYLVMELLQGQPLDARLRQGSVSVREAIRIGSEMLSALAVLHHEGLVHRDLKPSNLFLTPHGTKILDFGLVRHANGDGHEALTQAGMMLGTPSYMSPEQASGKPVDSQSDIFSAGSILYEMLAGRRAFAGTSIPEVLISVVNHQPPALAGSPEVVRLDRVIQRAIEKRPERRYHTVEAMLADLQSVPVAETATTGTTAPVRAVTRLIVLPFRMLMRDPETEFLSYSLPDAVASTLSGIQSLVVRSSMAASRFDPERPDLKVIADQAEVDAVLTGTLIRAGDQIRVSVQLVEAPGGTLIHAQSAQAGLRDLFQLQDELVHRIVESLKIPLTARDAEQLRQDAPQDSSAYGLYLRANELLTDWQRARQALDLYEQCVRADPNFAPGWARLGRCYRLIEKYFEEDRNGGAQAEQALQRALSINPDLTLAHHLYAQLESDMGRAQAAMVRLLKRAAKNPTDPDLFAGLVHVLRYCGLLDASVAAHQRARRIDPHIATSVAHTYFQQGDYQACLDESGDDKAFIGSQAMVMLGRAGEAAAIVRKALAEMPNIPPRVKRFLLLLLQASERRATPEDISRDQPSFATIRDPEGLYYWARYVSWSGEVDLAVTELGNAVELGYYCAYALERDPWLAAVREHPEYPALYSLADQRRRRALEIFREQGGERLLCDAASVFGSDSDLCAGQTEHS